MDTQEVERQFIALITANQQVIYKVCYVYATYDYTLQELYEETVINLWKAFPKFRGDSKISTWIYRIGMNTCISYFQKSSSELRTIPISFDLGVSFTYEDSDKNYYLQELYRMINKLGKLERALVLLWLEERSYQEISDILGISKNNVAVKLNRIKEKLKTMSNQ